MEDRSGIRGIILLFALTAIIIAALFFSQVVGRTAERAERASFGAELDAAYHAPYVGTVIAVGGVVQGAGRGKLAGGGGNQYTHWFDIINPAQKPFVGVRIYFNGGFHPGKGSFVIVEGRVIAPGRMQASRTTFVE